MTLVHKEWSHNSLKCMFWACLWYAIEVAHISYVFSVLSYQFTSHFIGTSRCTSRNLINNLLNTTLYVTALVQLWLYFVKLSNKILCGWFLLFYNNFHLIDIIPYFIQSNTYFLPLNLPTPPHLQQMLTDQQIRIAKWHFGHGNT